MPPGAEPPAGAPAPGPIPPAGPPGFAADAELAYREQAFRFAPGRALRLDPVYRARQLPLVAPGHPDVVPAAGEYVMGRYARPRASLALFVDGDALLADPALTAVVARLRESAAGRKIAWPLLARRRHLLHATVCPGLDPDRPGAAATRAAKALAAVPPFRIRVGGPWLGESFNVGRVYLPVYPERRGERDAIAWIQDRLGRAPSRFHAIGFLNLTDHLSVAETAELGAIVAGAGRVTVLEREVAALELALTHGDLLLASWRACTIPLAGAAPPRP